LDRPDRLLIKRIETPKGKGEGFGVKLFQIIILLVAFFLSGCSEKNPLKWRPMDLAPAAMLQDRNHTPLSSLDHLRGTVDDEVTEEFHGILPES